MNDKKTEALKLALDYILATNQRSEFWLVPGSNLNKTVTALREALAEQPAQQEPVGVIEGQMYDDGTRASNVIHWASRNAENDFPVGTLLYTSPQARQEPLTWERVLEIGLECSNDRSRLPYEVKVARAVEAAHGIKENKAEK